MKNDRKKKEPKEICPASYFNALDSGKPHTATRLELKQNGGVCHKCHEQFIKRHSKALSRNCHHTDVQSVVPTQRHPTHNENVRYADGHREPCQDFDYGLLDDSTGDYGVATHFASQAIQKFALRLYEKGTKSPKRAWAVLNALLFAAQLHPEQQQNIRWLAKRYGTGDANGFSLDVEYWRDMFNLPRGGGARRHRGRMRESALLTHEMKGHIIKNVPALCKVFQKLSNAVCVANKERDAIKCCNTLQKSELIDRLKPLSDLREQLIKQNQEATQDEHQEKLGIL